MGATWLLSPAGWLDMQRFPLIARNRSLRVIMWNRILFAVVTFDLWRFPISSSRVVSFSPQYLRLTVTKSRLTVLKSRLSISNSWLRPPTTQETILPALTIMSWFWWNTMHSNLVDAFEAYLWFTLEIRLDPYEGCSSLDKVKKLY